MLSEDVTGCRIDDLARHASESAFEEPRRITVRNEADVVTIGLLGNKETSLLRLSTDIGLHIIAKRKQCMLELPRLEHPEDVRLVLGAIDCSVKLCPMHPLDDLRVVPGRNGIEIHGHCPIEHRAELDLLVAAQTRIRRSALHILVDEVRDDVFGKPRREIPHIERDTEHVGHPPRITRIVEGAAAARPSGVGVGLARQRQVHADDFMSGVDHASGCDCGVNPARHRGDYFHGRMPRARGRTLLTLEHRRLPCARAQVPCAQTQVPCAQTQVPCEHMWHTATWRRPVESGVTSATGRTGCRLARLARPRREATRRPDRYRAGNSHDQR
ncbi:unannotated protein [freshwater metagenome]|uniref:Unannotated protein n=1 Tax=freshwater metagenome TaxID=449393 RepID=A0A6J7EKM3_9ZZZZ